jgi:hypothetical protein
MQDAGLRSVTAVPRSSRCSWSCHRRVARLAVAVTTLGVLAAGCRLAAAAAPGATGPVPTAAASAGASVGRAVVTDREWDAVSRFVAIAEASQIHCTTTHWGMLVT